MNIKINDSMVAEVASMTKLKNGHYDIEAKTSVYSKYNNGGLEKAGILYFQLPNVDINNNDGIILGAEDTKKVYTIKGKENEEVI